MHEERRSQAPAGGNVLITWQAWACLWELLAEVAVNGVLDREVIRSEAKMVPAGQRGLLLPQMHLQVREEVHILP